MSRKAWKRRLRVLRARMKRELRGYRVSRGAYLKARRRYKQSQLGPSLGERALTTARSLIGVMEQGGNNRGPKVSEIILANSGVVGEPWCGDFIAYCYRKAGSKVVSRPWASVRALRGLTGLEVTKRPRAGDLVVFRFDHVGLFEKQISPLVIQTIEGNTGATGAVSDSRTGGDGVYRKNRQKSQVAYYLRVTR